MSKYMNTNTINQYKVCKKLQNNQYPNLTPVILESFSYIDEINDQTIVTLLGRNFRDFSIVKIGEIIVEFVYISSEVIFVKIPRDLPSGLYPLYVSTYDVSSNIINLYIE